MPSPAAFAKSFGLVSGSTVAGYQLLNYTIGHQTITRYHVYHFPLAFNFRQIGAGTPRQLLSQLQQLGANKRDVLSDYGNPYECHIQDFQITGQNGYDVTITAMGVGVRVYR
jgi:hypothetical protein